jgi:hypothetical protein
LTGCLFFPLHKNDKKIAYMFDNVKAKLKYMLP